VRDIRFADRHGVVVLGIHRHPSLQRARDDLDMERSLHRGVTISDVPLAAGDVLLVSGPERSLRELAVDEDVTFFGTVDYERPRYRRAPFAVVVFGATVAAAGAGVTSPAIVGLTGLVLMIALGCVSARTAFRVDWRVVILIGALLTLGRAIEQSGAGAYLAERLLPLATTLGPRGMLTLLMLATVVLSVPMSNQAAALVMLPVGVHTALDMDLDARTFAVGICLAASCSFMTPLEPSVALVYGPGRYRFWDFLRVGGPLTLLLLSILALAVPLVWPFSRG
jgi:di/tricarboxylate transporter